MDKEKFKRQRDLGFKCKMFRLYNGITQQQVAIETNYSKETVSKFENGYIHNPVVYQWYKDNGL